MPNPFAQTALPPFLRPGALEKRALLEGLGNWWRSLGSGGVGSNLGQQFAQFRQNRAGGAGNAFTFNTAPSARGPEIDHSAPAIFSRGFQNIANRMNSGAVANAPGAAPRNAFSAQSPGTTPATRPPPAAPASPAPLLAPTSTPRTGASPFGLQQQATLGRQLAKQYNLPVGKNPFANDAEARTWLDRNPGLAGMAAKRLGAG